MQAIHTTFHGPTNTKGARYRAQCQAGSCYVSAHADLDVEQQHVRAATNLKLKLAMESAKRHKTQPGPTYAETCASADPWMRPTVAGCLADRSWVHVFTDQGKATGSQS